jgi:hypothetical protein
LERSSVLGWLGYFETVNTVTSETMHFHTFLGGDGIGRILYSFRIFPILSVTGKGCYTMKGKW